ncbi:carbohydrate esterase family 3 protein [Thozetella sp. PMI_491]|nr:carbohydrate esterase family 3 protein [Thozetella sp. PMI_491]
MWMPKVFLALATLAEVALGSPVTGTDLTPRQASKLRIMPLGDSITEITCWRALVWDMLVDAKYADQVQYVGSQNSNPQNCKPNTANWDEHHEGHSGWLAIDIANNYIEKWMKSTPADIVMFMLGTNDVVRGHTTADIIAACKSLPFSSYTKMVKIMRAANPKIKIIIDLVIPLSLGSSSQITAINAAIPGWAKDNNSTDSPIVIADCNTGFSTSMLRDGVHPNAAGDKVIASRVGPLLIDYVKQSLGK